MKLSDLKPRNVTLCGLREFTKLPQNTVNKRAENMRMLWKDPEFRETTLAAIRESNATRRKSR
jgi:hypothetical protein